MVENTEPVAGQNQNSPSEPQIHGNSVFTPELGAAICAELAEGKSLRTVCEQEGMPDKATVFRWLAPSNEAPGLSDFRDQYTRAKEEAADAMAEDILDISDEKLNDSGDAKLVNAAIQRNRLRVDTRKFLMAKMKPKKYGDKLDLTSGGDKIERGMSIDEINAVLSRADAEAAATEAPATA